MKLNEIFQVFNDFKKQNEISEQDVAYEFIQYLEQNPEVRSFILNIYFEKILQDKLLEIDYINFISLPNLQIALRKEIDSDLRIQFVKEGDEENDIIIHEIFLKDKRARIVLQ